MNRCSLTTELRRDSDVAAARVCVCVCVSAPKVTFFSQAPRRSQQQQQQLTSSAPGPEQHYIEEKEGCGGGRSRGVGYKAIHQAIR